MRKNLPDKEFFVGKQIPARPDVTITRFVDSGNDAHLFKAHSDQLARDVACKIIPRANLVHGPDGQATWRAEVHKADALQSKTVVKFEDIKEWKAEADQIDCVVLISEFVEGQNLRLFINSKRAEVSISFVMLWLETMLNVFNEMKLRNISHGDIHWGNILVEDRSSYDLMGPRYVFRVTDFGVADATSDQRFRDDYLQLAEVLSHLLAAVDYQSLSAKDKYIFNKLRHDFLSRHLTENDTTRDPIARQPDKLFRRLKEIGTEFEKWAAEQPAQLLSPFDFLSCEQIGDAPALLRALYSDRFLGLSEIESRNNVVVTGPRGCGKTTVFRSLSLRQKIRVNEADPSEIKYIGVYYRCDDLYFAFPRYRLPTRTEAFDLPIHFVTATLLAELLDALEVWGAQHFQEEFKRVESQAAIKMWNVLNLEPPHEPGSETFKALVVELEKQRRKAAERQRFANDSNRGLGKNFGVEVLQRACGVLLGSFSFLNNKPFYFFIDDYSIPKVTKDLQADLNRLLMQRTSFCFFKLSTESPVSFCKSDIDEKTYVENREFVLHNLGLVYLHSKPTPKMGFIEDVFRRRISKTVTAFPVKELGELIGSNPKQNNNDYARKIRGTNKIQHWGKETLCKLCSGDIHYVIGVVGDMVKSAGGPAEIEKVTTVPRLGPEFQNRAIRGAAGNFLKNLRAFPRYGERLVAIVESFGNVAHSFIKYRDSKNEKGNPPHQATRIEPYELFVLSDEAQRLYDELLRYSVFIEDFRGKSRRGKVVPRLYLRRFLIPHFNLTFSMRDSIELEPADFELFLLDPRKFEDTYRFRNPQDAMDAEEKTLKDKPGQQLPLELNEGGDHDPSPNS